MENRTLRISLTVFLAGIAAFCVAKFFFGENLRRVPAENSASDETRFEFPSKLRVATFNLHGYFDENRFSEAGKFQFMRPKPEKEKIALRRVILAARPDILAVQEIGGNAWLDELAEDLARDGLPFPYRTLLEAGDSHNRLAVLSRVPFSKTIKIAPPAHRLVRGLLGIVVPLQGGKMLRVYNVHLKSKVSSDPDDPECNTRRLGEARFLRRLIEFQIEDDKAAEKIPSSNRFPVPAHLKKNPPKLFAIVGDFNDDPDAPAIATLTPASFAFPLTAKDDDGNELTYFNPRKNYFHTFDRILVSPEIYKKFYIPLSAKIANFPFAAQASDHRLVYADFDFSGTLPEPENQKN